GAGVDAKIARIGQVVAKAGAARRTINHVRDALTPEPHLSFHLNALAGVLLVRAQSQGVANPAFRVAVYLDNCGVLEPKFGIDTQRPGYNPFTSFQRHQGHFQLGGSGPSSEAVLCVRNRQLLIVEDCDEAATRGTFAFFNTNQRNYLRSMAAYYLGQVRKG